MLILLGRPGGARLSTGCGAFCGSFCGNSNAPGKPIALVVRGRYSPSSDLSKPSNEGDGTIATTPDQRRNSRQKRKARRQALQRGIPRFEPLPREPLPRAEPAELSEDEYWAIGARESGDPNFHERYPEVIDRLIRAIHLAAEELGLSSEEREDGIHVGRGSVPNILAYYTAENVLPKGWDMVIDPYPYDADLDWGYEDDVSDEEGRAIELGLHHQAQEIWTKIEPQL